MNNYGKVAIGVRIGVAPNAAFFQSWTGLLLKGLQHGDRILPPSVGRPHALAANYIASMFLETDADTLWMLDDDMVFPADTLERLRASDPAPDIVSALCVSRRAPFGAVALLRQPDGTFRFIRGGKGIVPVDVCGMACTLIKRPVIEEAFKRRDQHQPFHFRLREGEDGDFCLWAASELKASVAVNYDVSIGHRTEFTASWSLQNDAPQMDFEPFGFVALSASLKDKQHPAPAGTVPAEKAG